MDTTLGLQIQEELQSLKSILELKDLSKLEELQLLSQLEALQNLVQLEELQSLKELQNLAKLEELQNLSKLEELRNLSKLEQLERLALLENLKELDNIQTLDRILKDHSETLAPIGKLIELRNLSQLDQLKELSQLDQLSSLRILEKLDLLNDPKFHQNISKLDQLDILKKGSRNIVIQQAISFCFEIAKVVLVSGLIIFFITRESGQEIISKALPAIGLGQSAQVNLGLKLLLQKQTPEDFTAVVNDVRSRIQNETNTVFSDSSFVSLSKRIAMLENLKNYSFKTIEVDLGQEANVSVAKKSSLFFSTTINQLEYEYAIAKGKEDKNLYNLLREVKLLLSQEKFAEALEKSYRSWNSSEALRNAAVISAAKIFQDDPRTLEEVMKNLPRLGEAL